MVQENRISHVLCLIRFRGVRAHLIRFTELRRPPALARRGVTRSGDLRGSMS